MPTTPADQHSLAPAEQYLRALWDARLLYLSIVALFVAGAVVITAMLPKVYQSRAIISVRPGPSLTLTGVLYDTVTQIPPRDHLTLVSPMILGRRLQASRNITQAARDAGIIAADVRLEEPEIKKWVEIDQLEADLLQVTVNQPTPEAAQTFAQHIVTRTFESVRLEDSAPETRLMLAAEVARAEAALTAAETRLNELDTAANTAALKTRRDRAALDLDLARKAYVPLRRRLDAFALLLSEQQGLFYVVDPPTLPQRPAFPRPVLNTAIGVIMGILVATFIVIVRSIFKASGSRSR